MTNPIDTYKKSKNGWIYATKVSGDVLAEFLIIDKMLNQYSESICSKNFLFPNSRDLEIYLNGDVYLGRDSYVIVHSCLNRDYRKTSKYLIKIIYSNYTALLKKAELLHTVSRRGVNYSVHELISVLDEYFLKLGKASSLMALPLQLEYGLQQVLKDEILKQGFNESELELVIHRMITPIKTSQTGNERKSLVVLAHQIERDPGLLICIKRNTCDVILTFLKLHRPLFYKRLNVHFKKYTWLGMSFFGGKPYAMEDFVQRLQDLIKNKKQTEQEKAKIKIKLNKKTQEIITFLREIAYIRTWRLEIMNHSNFLIKPFLERLAKRMDLSYSELIFLNWHEIKKYNSNKHEIYSKVIRQRIKGFGIVFDSVFKTRIVTGKNLENFKNYFENKTGQGTGQGVRNNIKGVVVCQGTVIGKAKVVKSLEDFSKFRQDDILVAQMTTPDWVPVIEKSSAIITDIGGLTSHAAIISRELNKPCIVGTKFATKVLRDGDLIEVDAYKGTVRIVKRSE